MDIPDLNRVADELDAFAAQPGAERSAAMSGWLEALVARGGSDLFLVAGAPPCVRVDGGSSPSSDAALGRGGRGGGPAAAVFAPAADLPRLPCRRRLAPPGPVRFRINLHRERGRAAAAIRALPREVPRLADLGFPQPIELLSRLARGLVLVGGPTGSGKTTTLAAIVGEINRRERKHVITIEDPIEYEHRHDRSLVEQQEIGIDVADFSSALRAAVRQAPDVIVVGEMRDPETMRMALAAAETGHLVLTTLHTTDVASAVSRIVDSFPAEQGAVRQELAMALSAVLVQALMMRADGRGRVPRRAAHGQLRRPPAHPAQRAAAPAPGDHDHAQGSARSRWRSRSRDWCRAAPSPARRRWCGQVTLRQLDTLLG